MWQLQIGAPIWLLPRSSTKVILTSKSSPLLTARISDHTIRRFGTICISAPLRHRSQSKKLDALAAVDQNPLSWLKA